MPNRKDLLEAAAVDKNRPLLSTRPAGVDLAGIAAAPPGRVEVGEEFFDFFVGFEGVRIREFGYGCNRPEALRDQELLDRKVVVAIR
jgi:hypothetical protein